MAIARKEIGIKELPNKDNPRIIEYHHTTTGQFDEQEIPWCSSFVNWVMEKAGYKGTDNALAISWAKWGVECEPRPGAICVMTRPGGNHVTFVVEVHPTYLLCLGGNQSNAVNIQRYDLSRVKTCRWPIGATIILPSKDKYSLMYDSMVINPSQLQQAQIKANRIKDGKARYEHVAKIVGCPWTMVGLIHILEASGSWTRHLHNGDPLTARTTHVPKGRPKTGSAPFSWEESAVDALTYDKIKGPYASIGKMLEALEGFNGLGYKKRGIPSPYLWSGCNHYIKGKYVADGVFDPEAVSQQIGCAVLLKLLNA